MLLLDLGFPIGALRENARLVRQRLDDHPDVDRQQAGERLAKAVVGAVVGAMEAVNAELQNVVRVGLMVSSARAGVKKMGFVFTDRLDPKRRMECSLATAVRGQELVLTSDCLGRTGEVARFGLRDQAAPAALRQAAERFLLDTAEAFASGSAASKCAPARNGEIRITSGA